MSKVNLNKNLVDLDLKEIPNSNAGKLIANLLAQDTKGDALKKFSLATKLYNGEELDLDPSDFNLLKSFIEDSVQMSVLAKAQILLMIT
jgi:hypothetical protein